MVISEKQEAGSKTNQDELIQKMVFPEGILLENGQKIAPLEIAYQTYGQLSQAKDNAILICHALTGDQYVAGVHPITKKLGWWSKMVGPGLPIDTNKYFVICTNVLGSCLGTTGPRSIREDITQARRWGSDFPAITIKDMVNTQKILVDSWGIERLFAVIGGSMGGMQVLQWAVSYPDQVYAVIPIATSSFHSAQNIAFNEVGRQAIFSDPDWRDGEYWRYGVSPYRGLAVARMMAHITYLSEDALSRKFGRRLQESLKDSSAPIFGEMFQVQSYLQYQGSNFVRRFDANSYVTITQAMDWFDLSQTHDGDLVKAVAHVKSRFCVISLSSDWLFPTSRSRAIVQALNRVGAKVSFVEIATDKGHDAFLLEEPDLDITIQGFLSGIEEQRRLENYAS
ncbi:homoserine O-acetyltransferase [Commensalibacter papalotli (ex Botero et al. 2024)]|uniref:Homoserine O-acetyltransferase n=1 Tax=Commensalibacter papalotli (ex Botero et al. 2024) TaxID=2972766 RepID=A0ABM9HS21_9PROT|nr:homoserine O-acetyltransferase [Commensalibacter papalotli (ex Botero et al. 2024)]CAI3940390.1 Homoserine O-acetyltransferase (MET2) (PDB:2VAT) [Commensalibacter papalotli (ex Botero et al. 2024)]CAI3950658.1 Homoserine O-acetyltransferase (MET2) (PDB:2VAT) [Commensalibacter papalotli (ex Botero et al. 2024)]